MEDTDMGGGETEQESKGNGDSEDEKDEIEEEDGQAEKKAASPEEAQDMKANVVLPVGYNKLYSLI
jgi:hypothetical protein